MQTSAPKARQACATPSWSVATNTCSAPLSRASSQTHCTMGRPPTSASGLPGKRLAA
jgi:hypothetical protein